MVRYRKTFVLSDLGSDRATAYAFSNKSVTLGGKTHVVWTDAIAIARGRTFDHATGQWGATFDIGAGCDNHNNPSLTVDRDGRLHIAYGPHGAWGVFDDNWPTGNFKYAVASEPNSLAGLEKVRYPFGYRATYANLLHLPQGLDVLVCRGGEHPPSLMFHKQTPMGGWSNARPLMCIDAEQIYTFYGGNIVSDAKGTLYVAAHFYSQPKSGGHSLGVMAIKSADVGETWTDLAGNAVRTPIRYDASWAVPHPPAATCPRLSGLSLDSRGRCWALTGGWLADGSRHLLLSCWEGAAWRTTDLVPHIPQPWIPFDAAMTIDTADRVHIAFTGVRGDRLGEPKNRMTELFGHLSSEVFHMVVTPGGEVAECNQISPTDENVANWLPTISKAGPFHPVKDPVILYTHGNKCSIATEGCKTSVHTQVCCVMMDQS